MNNEALNQTFRNFLYSRGYLDESTPVQDDELLVLDSLDYLALSLDIEKTHNVSVNDAVFFAGNASLSDTLGGFYTRLATACQP